MTLHLSADSRCSVRPFMNNEEELLVYFMAFACRATVIKSGALPALVGMLGSGRELPLSIYVLHALHSILSSDTSGKEVESRVSTCYITGCKKDDAFCVFLYHFSSGVI